MRSLKKEPRVYLNLRELYRLFRDIFEIAKPKTFFLFLSSICIGIVSLAQVVSLGLVIPILNGLINKSNFSNVLTVPVVGPIIKRMPFINSNIEIFLFTIILILLAVYIENFASFVSNMLTLSVATRVNQSVKNKMFERYLGFIKAFYDKYAAGELSNVLAMAGECGTLIVRTNKFLINAAVTITFLTLLMWISWKLTLSVFILLLVNRKVIRVISNKIYHSADKAMQENMKLGVHLWDILFNIPLVKLYATEEKELKKFVDTNEEIRRHNFNVCKKQEALPALIDIINSTGIIIILCISVFLFIYRGDYSLSKFLIYFVILRRFTTYVNQSVAVWGTITETIPRAKQALWVFDDSDKGYIESGAIKFEALKEGIAFKNVSFCYVKDMPILTDVTFSAKKGDVIAIVGPTGAGKTTIVNFLPRFYEYEAGSIEMDGINIREFDIKSLRKKIGVVSQDVMILNDTIKNNIIYGLEKWRVDTQRLDEAAHQAQAYDFIMSLPDKYDTFVGDRGVRLSGGERQRISIARAILKDPDILILDEATSALDTETETLIQKAIENLIKSRTVFVVAHRLSTIKNADWVIVLENGKIREQGKPQELLERKEIFYRYWELQRLFY